ncbi:MAG: family 10 glycosylhydrolase [Armatimonadetes bacterium]|nr:family 10 glycosylhydrolase [Armatimonadota bacterium]
MKTVIVSCILLLVSAVGHAQPPEMRAFWADTWHEALNNATQVDQMLQRVRSANCNAVVVQARRRGDAFYNSLYEPKNSNVASGFDPLAYLILRARTGFPRIEVHAWFVVHLVHNTTTWPTQATHVLNRIPEAVTQNNAGSTDTGSGLAIDFGHPAGADQFFRVVMDVLRRYDVDGVHMDYIRYMGTAWGYNPVSVARFNAKHGRSGSPATNDPQWLQWRRDQVTALMRRIYANSLAIKPYVNVSAALITWGNGPTSDNGWLSSSAYSSVFQDWRSWMQEGILDTGMPMCYYNQSQYPNYYANWIAFIKDRQYGRQATIGLGNYLNTISNTMTQIDQARLPTAGGNSPVGLTFYSYAACNTLNGNTQWYNSTFYSALAQKFGSFVPTPEMPWKTSPTKVALRGCVVQASDMSWVDNATVTLYRNSVAVRTLTTDGCGQYAAVDLEPGSYMISVTKAGVGSAIATKNAPEPGQLWNTDFVIGSTGSAIRAASLKEAELLSDGTRVIVAMCNVMTGNNGSGAIWVSDQYRGRNVRVLPQATALPWVAGDVVAISGVLATDGQGARYLTSATVTYTGATAPLALLR